MTSRQSSEPTKDVAGPPTETLLVLLGSGDKKGVPCTTRWMDDRHAYVVAPLATATTVHQQWEAMAVPSIKDQTTVRERRLHVELISADILLGSDSGKEGLLLRYFERKPGTA